MDTFALDSLILCLQVILVIILVEIILVSFLLMLLRKMTVEFWNIIKMNEGNSIETLMKQIWNSGWMKSVGLKIILTKKLKKET